MSKAQELSDALDRMDNLLNPEYRLLSVPGDSATAIASRADMAMIRSALSSSSEHQAAQQDERIVKIEQAYKELSWMFHDQIVAQQAAWIEWHHGAGAEAGMQWIENGLCGPGHIPNEDEPYGKEAQAWYDANNSDPFPVCQCGRPSNMMWMGQGFCCQAHSDAARASNGGTDAR